MTMVTLQSLFGAYNFQVIESMTVMIWQHGSKQVGMAEAVAEILHQLERTH